MAAQVIVLNGGSSSGKSSIVRSLQEVLPVPWLTVGVDSFIGMLPETLLRSPAGIDIAPDGMVAVGSEFRALEAAWMQGVAATVRAGAPVVIDDVFLGGHASQERWRRALAGLDVLWVGVRCAAAVAVRREAARGDRDLGMAELQADRVHHGVSYDLEVDTTDTDPTTCARAIATRAQT